MSRGFLLDANVLIALIVAEHEHHEAASAWASDQHELLICPVVEGALVRFLIRMGESSATASAVLKGLRGRLGHLPDDVSFADVDLSDVQGHRQVTDVYLATLADVHGLTLATFDAPLARLRPRATSLIPTTSD